MIKKLVKYIITSLVVICMFSNTVFAATEKGSALTSVNEVSQLLPKGQKSSRSTSHPSTRGEALALSLLDITNAGNGAIGIYAMTVLHRDVVWGMTTIYLDRWNAEEERWEFLEEFITVFPNGSNNGETTSLDVSILVTNQPSGYYYRLRGSHEIEYKNDSNKIMWEGHTTSTNGVFITDTP